MTADDASGGPSGDDDAAPSKIKAGDGSLVEPYTLEGYFDRAGHYIPGWYDSDGVYHLGYGFFDANGEWQVVYGYYDRDGAWVETDEPVRQVASYRERTAEERAGRTENDGEAGDTLQVTQLWNDQLLEVETFEVPRTITMGPGDQDDFVADEGLGANFPLVEWESGRYRLTITPEMSGVIERGGHTWTVQEAIDSGVAASDPCEEGRFELVLGPRASARLHVGANTFLVNFVRLPAGVSDGISRVDTSSIPYLAMSAAAHGLFVLLALSLPGQAGALSIDRGQAYDRFVNANLSPVEKETAPQHWSREERKDELSKGKPGPKAAGKEGAAGTPESTDRPRESVASDPPKSEKLADSRARDRNVAMEAGALAMLDDGVASRFGAGSKAVGSVGISALEKMDDVGSESGSGFGGLGVQGSGRGVGAVEESGQSIGGIDTRYGDGNGGHPCEPYPECANSELGQKKEVKQEHTVVLEPPTAGGGLSRNIIKRVVRSHRRELKYCYEQQLQTNPDLAGRVNIQFTVSASGDVMTAQVRDSSLENVVVEQCITRKVRGWTFPAPKGGTLVEVNYPFSFSSASQ